MRILWLTVDRSNRIACHFDNFRHAVSGIAEIITLKKDITGDKSHNIGKLSHMLINGKIKPDNILIDYLNQDPNFDFIFCDAFFAYMSEQWDKISIPTGILIEDVQREVPKYQIKIAKDQGIKTIFHRSNFAFHKFHPKAKEEFNCFWLPHSIKSNRCVGHEILNNCKSKEVIHVGAFSKQDYPYRYVAVECLKNKPYFTVINRPQDEAGISRKGKWPIDEDYDNLLRSAKICITGGSLFNTPVQKYIEIPASGALLMSNWFPDLGLLGFKNNENMVVYKTDNIIKTIENLLKDDNKIQTMAKKGLDLILSRHSSLTRAEQFINYICTIINKTHEFPYSKPCTHQVNFKRG